MMAAKQGQVHAVSMLLENDAQVDLPAKVSFVFYRIVHGISRGGQ